MQRTSHGSHELPLMVAGLRGGAVGLASAWWCCLGGFSVSSCFGGEVIGFEKMCCLVVQETRKKSLTCFRGKASHWDKMWWEKLGLTELSRALSATYYLSKVIVRADENICENCLGKRIARDYKLPYMAGKRSTEGPRKKIWVDMRFSRSVTPLPRGRFFC
jgi:hypothetical protein